MRTASPLFVAAAFVVGLPFAAFAQSASWSDQPIEAAADDPNIAVSYDEDGRYYTEDDIPTFNINDDGAVDWLTFSGFRRYHSECHVCHGPDGEGSTYAPKIKNSAVNMDYYDFVDVVVNGRMNGNSVMPHFGDNANVMCYLDDIYTYLKARGMEAIPRGRPAKKEAKSDMIREAEDACMGS
ncbi:c-type cytochrome, methanol metabolism-related [Thalassococcus halodurans]|uniref:C-type cytochrome, methanol metabolism-related n=1 Tax=Thalassococcus halodurans TaxID=373675 RepID=A0A1H6BKK0_9RHOB|nr:c-type cytochrome, methanol metabolism-related [Thalassococcus halodurans]SEG61241.1 c-type cytochrome, methanol metabolism-related [Thalassococcus halodurans]